MANQTAKIQGTINGQTVTIAEVAIADIAGLNMNSNQQVCSLNLSRPIKVDAGTAINLVVSHATATAISTACVHTISKAY